MYGQRNSDPQVQRGAAASLPPAMIGETGWDILLALNAEEEFGLTLETLAPLVSVSRPALHEWLDWLDDRELVASAWRGFSDQSAAVITRAGIELVRNYLLATSSLQGGAH